MRETMKKSILIGALFLAISATAVAEVSVRKISGRIVALVVNDFVNLVAMVGPEGVFLVDSGFADEAGNLEESAVSETVDSGKSCDELNGATLLKDWSVWSGTVFDEVDSQMWAETICRSLMKNTTQ